MPARTGGLAFVVGLHVVALWALSAAFVVKPTKHQEPIVLKPVAPTVQPPVDPPTPVQKPMLKEVDVPRLYPPVIVDEVPSNPLRNDPPTLKAGPNSLAYPPSEIDQSTGGKPEGRSGQIADRIPTASAVCVRMPRPEVPAVAWTGEAAFHVLATVSGGRVVGTEFKVTAAGLDARSRRALQRSVEAALDGYDCPGEHRFVQEFSFRLD
jgi:hypothetical protein